MTLDEIERAITLAKSRGVAELQCAIGQGKLKVIVRRKKRDAAAHLPVAAPVVAADVLKTDYFGVFADAVPAVKPGDRVDEGQIVGFLVLGEICFAVVAKKAGMLSAKHVRAGDLVGYGAAIFDYG
jgi:biotin carboxyl carrier protein